ncbi:hypothetical protein [Paludibacterium paludis]|uniref:PNPLA domain-containing protein n=1 Tax=Paludibacterium paludis TaxID=1225769 RepID=A0A918P459_9NEIS|nr:hypothetical protein [Paludibacterium paludis]GGY19922.1 hypothetical protein GCM10011289_24250 [Paludibacterium paludis]
MLLSAATTPDLPLWKAWLASRALPLLMPPVEVDTGLIPDGAVYGKGSNRTVRLRDGGIHDNLPWLYLDAQPSLLLSFTENRGIAQRRLTLLEKLKDRLCEEPAYRRRQADMALADAAGLVHYIDAGVSTAQLKKAKRDLARIADRSAMAFDRFLLTWRPPAESADKAALWRELNRNKYGKRR